MPTDCDYVDPDQGSVFLEMYKALGLADIQIRLLPTMELYKKYLSGSLYDIVNLELS